MTTGSSKRNQQLRDVWDIPTNGTREHSRHPSPKPLARAGKDFGCRWKAWRIVARSVQRERDRRCRGVIVGDAFGLHRTGGRVRADDPRACRSRSAKTLTALTVRAVRPSRDPRIGCTHAGSDSHGGGQCLADALWHASCATGPRRHPGGQDQPSVAEAEPRFVHASRRSICTTAPGTTLIADSMLTFALNRAGMLARRSMRGHGDVASDRTNGCKHGRGDHAGRHVQLFSMADIDRLLLDP